MAYGCHEERYPLPIAAVDTHRPNPKKMAQSASASGTPTEPTLPDEKKVSTARDYFGATTESPGTAEPSAGGVAEQVSKALEKGMEGGEMTPKAAARQID